MTFEEQDVESKECDRERHVRTHYEKKETRDKEWGGRDSEQEDRHRQTDK